MIDNRIAAGTACSGAGRRVPRRVLAAATMVLAAAVAAAGCGPGPTPPGASASLAATPDTSMAGASPPAGPGTSDGSGDTAHLDLDGLVLDYPADWRAFHYQEVTRRFSVLAWLGTVEVHDPCTRTADTVSCGAGYVLSPHSLVVRIETGGGPMGAAGSVLQPPAGATPITVGGLPAYVEDADPGDLGGDTGATKARTWVIAMPGSVHSVYRLVASVRGPLEDDLLALVGRVVAGARYDPPPQPLPTGATAARDATVKALGELAQSDVPDAWACFPVAGSRTARVTSLPYGPVLRWPQQATCTTSIEPTPLQLWKLTLEMRLPAADPDAGLGSRTTIYLAPDGSPGESTTEGLTTP